MPAPERASLASDCQVQCFVITVALAHSWASYGPSLLDSVSHLFFLPSSFSSLSLSPLLPSFLPVFLCLSSFDVDVLTLAVYAKPVHKHRLNAASCSVFSRIFSLCLIVDCTLHSVCSIILHFGVLVGIVVIGCKPGDFMNHLDLYLTLKMLCWWLFNPIHAFWGLKPSDISAFFLFFFTLHRHPVTDMN